MHYNLFYIDHLYTRIISSQRAVRWASGGTIVGKWLVKDQWNPGTVPWTWTNSISLFSMQKRFQGWMDKVTHICHSQVAKGASPQHLSQVKSLVWLTLVQSRESNWKVCFTGNWCRRSSSQDNKPIGNLTISNQTRSSTNNVLCGIGRSILWYNNQIPLLTKNFCSDLICVFSYEPSSFPFRQQTIIYST